MFPSFELKQPNKEEIDARPTYDKEKIIKEVFQLDKRSCSSNSFYNQQDIHKAKF